MLTFAVKNQLITSVTPWQIVAESIRHVPFACVFDDEWDAYQSRVVIFSNGDVKREVLLPAEPAYIPWEVLKTGGLYISCVGIRQDAEGMHRITTKRMDSPVNILMAGELTGDIPDEPTPSLIEQILAAIESGGTGGGGDGISPTATVVKTGNVATITITDKNGETTATISDGYTPQKGIDYDDGAPGYTPVKGVDYDDGAPGYTPQKGVDYDDGEDGYSPTARVEKSGGVATITITDKDGQTTATVSDGYTPQKGVDYFDGYTPQKGVDYFDGYTPVKGVDYFDGNPGYTPVKGVDYDDGAPGYTPVKGVDYFDGDDGVSPTLTVSKTGKVVTITATDKNGTTTATVSDGDDGDDGDDYVLTAQDKADIADLVIAALPTWQGGSY